MSDDSIGMIGIVGLGIMGGAMARNLAAAGWQVHGFDVSSDICIACEAQGIVIEDSVALLAAKVSYMLTCLPNAEALMDVACEIAASSASGIVLADTSTLAIDNKHAARDILENAGHVMLDCPVSGTGAQAAVADLVIYASGNAEAIERFKPVFSAIGREEYNVGDFGDGSRMKFVANFLVTKHNVASAEAITMGIKAGLDPHKVVEVVGAGIATSRIFQVRAPLMADNCYEPPTAHLATAQKGFGIIAEYLKEIGCPTPLFTATQPIYAAAMDAGHATDDSASVCTVLEEMAGIKR